MAKSCFLFKTFAAAVFALLFAGFAPAQVGQQMPEMPEGVLLPDIFRATEQMRDRFRSVEFKERIAFRLAAVLPEGRDRRNVDFRQSADYTVTIRPNKTVERKFLQADHSPLFTAKNLLKGIDIPTIQETMPPIATLQTGLFGFVSKEYVNGYKELGHEKVGKRNAIKMELRFRPGRMPVERCILWVDEQTHAPLRAELKVGDIGRFSSVRLIISYEDADQNSFPTVIHQEMGCSTFEQGIPLRLEHTAIYSELRLLPIE